MPTEPTGLRRLAAWAALFDGLLAALLGIAGAWMFRTGTIGMGAAEQREQYAGGMLLGSLALLAWILAAISAVAGLVCWRAFRQARQHGAGSMSDAVAFAFGLLPPAALLATWAGHALLQRFG
ncbi:MAG: hypothetical protein FIA97_09080 [Methylococcaceae bacterium]|nr:hypothetical protein [Methylococcaceae bacterium]